MIEKLFKFRSDFNGKIDAANEETGLHVHLIPQPESVIHPKLEVKMALNHAKPKRTRDYTVQ